MVQMMRMQKENWNLGRDGHDGGQSHVLVSSLSPAPKVDDSKKALVGWERIVCHHLMFHTKRNAVLHLN